MRFEPTLIPRGFWTEDRFNLPPHQRMIYLRLLTTCERDGLVKVDRAWLLDEKPPLYPTQSAYIYHQIKELEARGLVLLYGQQDAEYAWVLDAVASQAPSGRYSRPRQPEIPAPPQEEVIRVLSTAYGRNVPEEEASKIMPRSWGKRTSSAAVVSDEDVQAVYTAWLGCLSSPERSTLTAVAARLIRGALEDHSVDEVVTLMRYAAEADEPRARFWRGEAPDGQDGATYLGLDNLLARTKLQGKIMLAMEWAGAEEHGDTHDDALGPLAAYREPQRQAPEDRPMGRPKPEPRRPTKPRRQMSLGGLEL